MAYKSIPGPAAARMRASFGSELKAREDKAHVRRRQEMECGKAIQYKAEGGRICENDQ